MNEHETTPEGQQAPAGEQAQGTPAEGYRHPAEGLRGPSGSSDETARPGSSEPVTQPVPHSVVAAEAPRPGYGQYPPNPWAAPAAGQPAPAPAMPAPAPAQPTSQWAQPTSAVPAGAYQPAYAGQSHPGLGGQPGQPGQPPVPPWAAGPGAVQSPPPGDRRFGRFAATAAAAVVLALGAGTVGAVTALSFDDDSPSVNATNTAGSGKPAPVIDRSSLASIAAAVQDSVVSITTDTGEGSGVVLTADGYILSNNHVVGGAANNKVTVVFRDGTKAEATVVGTDARTDLGVIKAEGVSNLTAAKFGDSAAMKVGDTVLALGSPLGLQGSVTSGIISAKDRTIQVAGEQDQSNPFGGGQQSGGQSTIAGLLQTDAPINPGNSGGALVNTNGEVIGINTAIATSGQGSGSIGLGFAIPSNKAKEVAEALKTGQKVSHPFLGVSLSEAEGGGALVSSVSDNSPAQKAGIQRGDVITQIDGKAVNGSDDVITAVQAGKVGQAMTVTYTRSGREQTVNATLAEAS